LFTRRPARHEATPRITGLARDRSRRWRRGGAVRRLPPVPRPAWRRGRRQRRRPTTAPGPCVTAMLHPHPHRAISPLACHLLRHPRRSGSTARFVRSLSLSLPLRVHVPITVPIDHHQTSCVLLVLFAFSDVYSTIPATGFHLIPLKTLSNNLKLFMVMISYRFPHSS